MVREREEIGKIMLGMYWINPLLQNKEERKRLRLEAFFLYGLDDEIIHNHSFAEPQFPLFYHI